MFPLPDITCNCGAPLRSETNTIVLVSAGGPFGPSDEPPHAPGATTSAATMTARIAWVRVIRVVRVMRGSRESSNTPYIGRARPCASVSALQLANPPSLRSPPVHLRHSLRRLAPCLLYTSDAADE